MLVFKNMYNDGIFNLEIMGDTGLLLLHVRLPKPCASVFSCTDECLGAERNRTHFYCIPKHRKYHFIGLFFIRLGTVQLTAADASVNICKGGTFRELAAADYCAPAGRANGNRANVLYLCFHFFLVPV